MRYLNCKADCPNTNVCEHGYCVPHQYSYCHCVTKDNPPLPRDTIAHVIVVTADGEVMVLKRGAVKLIDPTTNKEFMTW